VGVARAFALAILLAVITPSFLVLAVPSSIPSGNLPACCRRDGKHHCAMMMAAEQVAGDHQFSSVMEKCPFRDASINGSRASSYGVTRALAYYDELLSHPSQHEQVFAAARIAKARSHCKRGPPGYLQS
jgi:hypothetical protein